MNFLELALKLLPWFCKFVRWITGRKPVKTRILIVEDNQDDYELIERKLNRIGYFTVHARTGRCAECRALDEFFSVAFVDLQLPGMSGVEVLQRLQELSPHTRCAIITGDASRLGHAKFFHYKVFTKDVGPETLRRFIEKETI